MLVIDVIAESLLFASIETRFFALESRVFPVLIEAKRFVDFHPKD
jgi:hypothetical protein